MENCFTMKDQVLRIKKAELHVPAGDDGCYLHLSVSFTEGDKGFFIVGMPLPLVSSIDELDGKRIHIAPDGMNYEDDTTGADILVAYGQSDLNYWHGYPDEDMGYGEILIDFTRIKDMQFRVKMELSLTESEDDPEELTEDDYIKAKGEFIVTADQDDPYG